MAFTHCSRPKSSDGEHDDSLSSSFVRSQLFSSSRTPNTFHFRPSPRTRPRTIKRARSNKQNAPRACYCTIFFQLLCARGKAPPQHEPVADGCRLAVGNISLKARIPPSFPFRNFPGVPRGPLVTQPRLDTRGYALRSSFSTSPPRPGRRSTPSAERPLRMLTRWGHVPRTPETRTRATLSSAVETEDETGFTGTTFAVAVARLPRPSTGV